MKVIFPIRGVSATSTDILPASCTKQPAVNCTAAPTNIKQGYSNQEIYEGIMSFKENLVSIFKSSKKDSHPINYLI